MIALQISRSASLLKTTSNYYENESFVIFCFQLLLLITLIGLTIADIHDASENSNQIALIVVGNTISLVASFIQIYYYRALQVRGANYDNRSFKSCMLALFILDLFLVFPWAQFCNLSNIEDSHESNVEMPLALMLFLTTWCFNSVSTPIFQAELRGASYLLRHNLEPATDQENQEEIPDIKARVRQFVTDFNKSAFIQSILVAINSVALTLLVISCTIFYNTNGYIGSVNASRAGSTFTTWLIAVTFFNKICKRETLIMRKFNFCNLGKPFLCKLTSVDMIMAIFTIVSGLIGFFLLNSEESQDRGFNSTCNSLLYVDGHCFSCNSCNMTLVDGKCHCGGLFRCSFC